MASEVKYSPKAAMAIGFLKRFYNDIEIYVEDTSCHNMVLLVCRAILGPDVRLYSVTQLGGKTRVIAACRLDQKKDNRKRLYIIDGDLDLLVGVKRPSLRHLYRLRAYCFENILISEAALIEVGIETRPNQPPHKIASALNHEKWMRQLVETLLPLFIIYGIVFRLQPEIQTVGMKVFEICTNRDGFSALSRAKVAGKMRSLVRQLRRTVDLNRIRSLRVEIASRAVGAIIRLTYHECFDIRESTGRRLGY